MNPREYIEAMARKANETQKIIVGIITPIVIIILGYGIMTLIDKNDSDLWDFNFDPNRLSESWWGWLIVFIAISFFEWLWFKTRQNVDNSTTDYQTDDLDSDLYTKAASEIVKKSYDPALYAKAFSESGGDENRTQTLFI